MTTNNFKPIPFNTEMVQAILAGRKTQTRRALKISQPFLDYEPDHKFYLRFIPNDEMGPLAFYSNKPQGFISAHCPGEVAKYDIGNILWVRETFCESVTPDIPGESKWKWCYRADSNLPVVVKWKPSLFMPKEAARIFLKITNVRCERLQDISEEDAIAEGIERYGPFGEFKGDPHPSGGMMRFRAYSKAARAFQDLWDSINAKKHPWKSNPWVWVYDFERIEKPENFLS